MTRRGPSPRWSTARRHSARWKNLGVYVWPNNYVGATWTDELKYLKYWIRKRLAWIDRALPGTCATLPVPQPITPLTAPPSVTVDRSKEPWPGEAKLHHADFIHPDADTPAAWACPR